MTIVGALSWPLVAFDPLLNLQAILSANRLQSKSQIFTPGSSVMVGVLCVYIEYLTLRGQVSVECVWPVKCVCLYTI